MTPQSSSRPNSLCPIHAVNPFFWTRISIFLETSPIDRPAWANWAISTRSHFRVFERACRPSKHPGVKQTARAVRACALCVDTTRRRKRGYVAEQLPDPAMNETSGAGAAAGPSASADAGAAGAGSAANLIGPEGQALLAALLQAQECAAQKQQENIARMLEAQAQAQAALLAAAAQAATQMAATASQLSKAGEGTPLGGPSGTPAAVAAPHGGAEARTAGGGAPSEVPNAGACAAPQKGLLTPTLSSAPIVADDDSVTVVGEKFSLHYGVAVRARVKRKKAPCEWKVICSHGNCEWERVVDCCGAELGHCTSVHNHGSPRPLHINGKKVVVKPCKTWPLHHAPTFDTVLGMLKSKGCEATTVFSLATDVPHLAAEMGQWSAAEETAKKRALHQKLAELRKLIESHTAVCAGGAGALWPRADTLAKLVDAAQAEIAAVRASHRC